ncbi:DUF1553 domain-containing protein [Aureliella helgolandensis]|uniref:Planctomycete cytochrome C n=1 Tax=Aureliella helgolandensis TaxID=2527968 RepID=A0A518GG38_9BACT|nr:DUF1553 domain-containing protein [Aureliella helgolandensis]QDV27540.1 Planctomycete cytochrome C [Aureliella helgolandensis]
MLTILRNAFASCMMVLTFVVLPCLAIDQARADEQQVPDAEALAFFETNIRPLLVEHCYDCHAEDNAESELRLDTLQGMLEGGLAGASVVPGRPAASLLLTAVRYQDSDLKMPPDSRLTQRQVADLTRWIEMGAPHPESGTVQPIRRGSDVDLELGRQHWAFVPPVKECPPPISAGSPAIAPSERRPGTIQNPIDAFVISRLEEQGLQRAATSDKHALLRRATFDLIGLPPTPEEIADFLADESPEAFQRVVDRLLASHHYGERWGRHWLDVARYADSNGLDENVAFGNAWRYRDYVINAFNCDKPYDEFITEQLAGDLLDSGSDLQRKHEQLTATGFLVLGPKVLAEQDEAKMEMDIIDEQIDTVGKGILGLTLGCARCHTHKFDPISHHDYYGLAGIFKSTHTMDSYKTVAVWHENSVATAAQRAALEQHQQRVAEQEKAIAELQSEGAKALELAPEEKLTAAQEKELPEELKAKLKERRDALTELNAQPPEDPTAMGVVDGTPADTSVHLRGSHLTLGDTVPRRFPQVLTSDHPASLPAEQSGRLELANWLTNGRHPLTARVMVNRIWRGHFGQGIVKTVDNFGLQGDRPSHPKLLDWLAVHFVDEGWSVKSLHRLIMLSETYQMSSQFSAENDAKDPGNRFLWRFNLRRIEAEAIRDSLLAVSGKIDLAAGGKLLQYDNREYVFNHTSNDKSTYDTLRRSIYVPIIRNHLYDVFQLFDYTDASVLNGDRNTSTIAPQALFLMNSSFVDSMSLAMADRILSLGISEEQRIEKLYLESYGRPASQQELAAARRFIQAFEESLAVQPATAELPLATDSEEEGNAQSGVDGAVEVKHRVWQAFCQSMVSSSEFIYVR